MTMPEPGAINDHPDRLPDPHETPVSEVAEKLTKQLQTSSYLPPRNKGGICHG
jgi:hypothetical protein